MKTFKDLVFEPWIASLHANNKRASIEFENGFGVSVLFGYSFYSNGIDTYELAVLFDGDICYSTEITDDVLGWITENQITEVMEKLQNLKAD